MKPISVNTNQATLDTSAYSIRGLSAPGGPENHMVYVAGGVWFDEVEIQGTQTGKITYPTVYNGMPTYAPSASGSAFIFCVGDVQ